MKPTVHDIARAAGVSLATVDRVLNDRAGVRDQTRERVTAAMADLGYVRDVAAANLARRRLYRFEVIAPDNANPFMQALRQGVGEARRHAARERMQIALRDVPAFDEAGLLAALEGALARRPDGLAFVAIDSAPVGGLARRLRAAGVGVVTLVSDLSDGERDHYVGIDNIAAGRTAASLLGRFLRGRGGRVAVVTGSLRLRDHRERLEGFLSVLGAEFPDLAALPALEGQDAGAEVARRLAPLLPEVVGVYSLGAGNDGLLAALRGGGEAPAVIAHELDAASIAGLREGRIDAVLAQDPGHEIRSAIRLLRAHADRLPVIPDQERIRIEIYLRDNLPPEDAP